MCPVPGRRKNIILLPFLVGILFVVWSMCWWAAEVISRVLLPPVPLDQDLRHFRRTRSLKHYLDNIQKLNENSHGTCTMACFRKDLYPSVRKRLKVMNLTFPYKDRGLSIKKVLVEPSSKPCASLEPVPVLTLVASAPHRLQHRHAIRRTWAKYQTMYFVLGLSGSNSDDELLENYVEAKQHGDMVVFDFRDHYQNQTLKTALMLHWSLTQCPQAEFLLKTDDDVLVNPWTLKIVIKDNEDAKLIGYTINDTVLQREKHNKRYVPSWLLNKDEVSKYLSGSAYLISGDYLRKILKKANHVPLVNLEDVYWTYLVGNQALHYQLTHEQRLSPFRPLLPYSCAYWTLASAHSFAPEQMVRAFAKIEYLAHNYNVTTVCRFFESYLAGDWLLYNSE